MNIVFTSLFLLCAFLLLCANPTTFLSALLDGASKSATVCVSLIATYSVWLGLMQVWEDSGLSQKLSKLLRPITRKLFATDDSETLDAVCMNLSVNLLGISGAATPYGIKAAQLLDKSPYPEYASALFFVLNATSLQIFPTSIIAVRVAMHSLSPNDVVLPMMLSSAFSTLLGAILSCLLIPKTDKKPAFLSTKPTKNKGACPQ